MSGPYRTNPNPEYSEARSNISNWKKTSSEVKSFENKRSKIQIEKAHFERSYIRHSRLPSASRAGEPEVENKTEYFVEIQDEHYDRALGKHVAGDKKTFSLSQDELNLFLHHVKCL